MPTAHAFVTVSNKHGMHARPSTMLAETAMRFEAAVALHAGHVPNGQGTDCKSVFALMMLGAAEGTEWTVQADGVDAQEAVEAIVRLFRGNFGES